MTPVADPIREFHEQHGPITLPHVHPSKRIRVDSVSGCCASCHGRTTELRGEITDRASHVEITAVGVCHQCRCLTMARLRWYTDGRVLQCTADGGWTEGRMRTDAAGTLAYALRNPLRFMRDVIASLR